MCTRQHERMSSTEEIHLEKEGFLSKYDDLSQEEIYDCFLLHDADGDGLVSTSEFPSMLRCLGFVLTHSDAKSIRQEFAAKEISQGDIQLFLSVIGRNYPRHIDRRELVRAFKIFDRKKEGLADLNELGRVLMCMGEKMSKEEWDKLLRTTLNIKDRVTPVAVKSDTFLRLFSPNEEEQMPFQWEPSGANKA